MPLKKAEKDYIVNKVVEILKSPQKETLIAQLREKVLNETDDTDETDFDDVVYSVIQAIDELNG